jgi:hypothetical protein
MQTIYLPENLKYKQNIKYLLNIISKKNIIQYVSSQDIIISKEDFNNGFQVSPDSIYLFKYPKLNKELFSNIIRLKKIIIFENNLHEYKFSDILNNISIFLNSLDEEEYSYSLIYFKINVVRISQMTDADLYFLNKSEKEIIHFLNSII